MQSMHALTRSAGALAALTVLIAGCTTASPTPTAAPAQPAKPAAAAADKPKVSIMVGGLNKHIYLTATLAKQLGLYDAEGVDVTLYDEPAGASAETSMLSGEVQFA